MLIDFQTIFIQIINFLVLVALLKRFLYKPILKAMRQRERDINLQLQEATDQKAIAQQEAERYRQLQVSFEQERETLASQAKSEVEAQRSHLLKMARIEVEQIKLKWANLVRQEQHNFLTELRQQMGEQLIKTLRLVLVNLAQTTLENSVIEVFLQRLETLSPEETDRLKQALSNLEGSSLVIRSAFPLSIAQQSQIRQALSTYCSDADSLNREMTVEQQPNLLCGVELSLPGYKIAWTVAHYLQSFENHVIQVLEQPDNFELPNLPY